MARRSSKPEEEKDAGKPVEPTESMPEHDLSSRFGESANAGGSDAFFRYVEKGEDLDQEPSEPFVTDPTSEPYEPMSADDPSEHVDGIDEDASSYLMPEPEPYEPEPKETAETFELVIDPTIEPMPRSYESRLHPAPFTDPSEPMPDELKELDDAED